MIEMTVDCKIKQKEVAMIIRPGNLFPSEYIGWIVVQVWELKGGGVELILRQSN